MVPPRAFISYAWESQAYRRWVEGLATRLLAGGVDVRLDAWHLSGGHIPTFMTREVTEADKVLVLCSPLYRQKVESERAEGKPTPGSLWEWQVLMDGVFVRGQHGKGIPVLARGAWEEAAPEALIGMDRVDLSRPESFEDQYLELLWRLTARRDPLPAVPPPELRRPAEPPVTGPFGADGEPHLSFAIHLDEENGGARVELRASGREPLTAPFSTDLLGGGQSRIAAEIERVQKGDCTADDIHSLGSNLWTRLQGSERLEAEVAAAFERCRGQSGSVLQLRLAVPRELEALPWEALYDYLEESTLATSPTTALVRTLHDSERKPRAREAEGAVRVLVVIPTGSGLDTGVEWERIQQSVRAAGDQVRLESLAGQVSPDRFAEALERGWDVVHFIGHGEVDDAGRVKLRFNGEAPEAEDGAGGAHWMTARVFAQEFVRAKVQLVVLNCCHAGAVETRAAAEPGVPAEALGSLGGYLRKAGVPAVVVMRYAIADSVAADFSRAFYQELLVARRAGRVDLAVQAGRGALLRNYGDGRRARSFVTPALYLAPGFEKLFAIEPQQPHETKTDEGPVLPAVELPPKLVNAVETGRCLPILGPGILRLAAERDASPPPSPRSLAQELGAQSEFPDSEKINALLDSSGDWLTHVCLERICQHFECTSLAERGGLIEAIQNAYRDLRPAEDLLDVAAWNVPGLVYAHVDGLLEVALQRLRGRELRVVDPGSLRAGTTPAPDDLVLVNLRGNYATPATLVLTEKDQDAVLDRMPEIASFVEDLMNARAGCSVLLLGVSPRDPLVRALCRHLLRDKVSKNRGTAYFVAQTSNEADRAYWRFDKLEWLEEDLETVVRGLSAAAARAAADGKAAR